MSIISEIAQGLSSIIKKNDELFMKKTDIQSLLGSTKVSASDVDEKLKDYVRIDKLMANDITQVPAFAGQIAKVDSALYIAESTTGTNSWRKIMLEPNDTL